MSFPPIGILTRGRAAYLDTTLRSLSATNLPADQPLIVFDDSSDDPATRAYLYGSDLVPCAHAWPQGPVWDALGLDVLAKHNPMPRGIAGRVRVERLSDKPLGVVNGSCEMIRRLFSRYPDAPGVLLMQDDVILNADWRDRMLFTPTPESCSPLGLLAGCRLNRPLKNNTDAMVLLTNSTTAQCLYLARSAFDKARGWFSYRHSFRAGFDNHLCTTVRQAGHKVCLLNPAVCQHIGMVSLVRPRRGWHSFGKRGRVSYEARPPYALADSVKTFCS